MCAASRGRFSNPSVNEQAMRVLIFGNGVLDCAAANCGVALRAMGHEVQHFDPDEHPRLLAPARRTWAAKRIVNGILSAAGRRFAQFYESAFVRAAEAYGPDLVLILPIDAVTPKTIADIKRRTHARIVGWFQDAVVNLGSHRFLLADYDALFFKDPYIVERLRDHGGISNVYFLPEACEPRRHYSLALTPEDERTYGCDLMVYGNLYPYRARMLESIADLDLRIHGARPSHWLHHPVAKLWSGREVYFDDKIRAVLAAKIVVNGCHFGEVRSVNARTFEVAGIGGFQLSNAPGVADYFEPGVEIAVFKGPRELREAVLYYLHRPEERRAIAARGQARAYRDHTYERRLSCLLATVGLPSTQEKPTRDEGAYTPSART